MGAEARTRLTLFGLLFVTLIAFIDLFVAPTFVGPALLAAILAMAVSMASRRLGLPPSVTFVVGLAGLLWYLTLIFEPSKTFYGLPSPGAARGLYEAIHTAYDRSRVDFAPVPVREGYVVLITGGFWLASAIGEVATFRWRRPLIAAAPFLALFAVELVVGAGKATAFWVALFLVAALAYLASESTHAMRFWGRWVTAWSDRAATDGLDSSTPIARRMAVACVAGALVAPLILPSIGSGVLAWRNLTGNGPGGRGPGNGTGHGATAGVVDPLVSIVPHLITQSNAVLFRVQTDDPEYLRLITLTKFDGGVWAPPDQEVNPVIAGNLITSVRPPSVAKEVNQTITIDSLLGSNVPAVEQAVSAELGSATAGRVLSATAQTGDLQVSGGLDNGLTYDVISEVPNVSFEDLRNARPGRVDDPELKTLPEGLSHDVVTLRDRWIAGATTPMERLTAIQGHLRNFDYSVTSDTQPTQDYLSRFLTESRAGYCQQFATAFALLARSLGYPTRVVVGFLPGSRASDGSYVVRGTDAHAWPEVYFAGFGWIRFEPTPRADSVAAAPPPYTAEGGTAPGLPPGNLQAGESPGPGSNPALQQLRNAERQAAGVNDRRGATTRRHPSPWRGAFNRFVQVTLLLVVAFLVAVPLLKRWQTRRRYDRARTDSALAAAAFAHFQDEAAWVSMPRVASESASAFALRVAAARQLPQSVALRLAVLYDAAQYSSTGVNRDEATEARSLAGRLDSALWATASIADRASMLFSPKGVFARGRTPRRAARPEARARETEAV
jgi:transglutaminase-like putative cysteine protease